MGVSGSTKLAIADAMKSLMREKSFGKISVGDICERCGMNRKSFYYHFRDKYDLVSWIYDIEFYTLIQQRDCGSWIEVMEEICRYLYSEREFYINAFMVTGQNSFCDYFKQTISELWQTFSDEPAFETSVYLYISEALTATIICWLREGRYNADEFTSQVRSAMRALGQF